jgi:hypothetical protein
MSAVTLRGTFVMLAAAAGLLQIIPVAGAPARLEGATPPVGAHEPTRVAAHAVVFSERSPLSAPRVIAERGGLDPVQAGRLRVAAYDLEAERFQLLVPPEYAPGAGFGLLVWVSPSADGGVGRPEIQELLRRHRLLWVGADGAGNQRPRWDRWGLALDAAHNVQRQYQLDRERIYVAGYSGGGRVASALALLFPEAFRGGLFLLGCDFHRRLPNPEQPGSHWPAAFPPPRRHILATAREQSRYVLLTGEDDFNRIQTRAVAEAMQAEGFRQVTYLEVPGLAHQGPLPIGWLDRALRALDGEAPAP